MEVKGNKKYFLEQDKRYNHALLNIEIKTIPHKKQRYDTAGDYFEKNGKKIFRISDLGDWRKEALIAVHELVEALLCKDRGIVDAQIDTFDFGYPKNGKYADDPGSSPKAPYHKEHMFALKIERALAKEMGIDWKTNEASFKSLIYQQ